MHFDRFDMRFSSPIGGKNAKAGYSIFEVLVVLTILTLVTGIVVASTPGQNRGLRLEKEFSELQAAISSARVVAVNAGRTQSLTLDHPLCDQSAEVELWFYPDGTASAAILCLQNAETQMHLELDPLTARLNRIPQ
ncbi:MAG: hypothetical protein ABJM43_10205 [Paracoccaceae bacterium]